MSPSRRQVLATLSAASYSRVLGANDRVQVGFIGYGLIGAQHVHDFSNQKDVDLVAMSDVYQPRLEQGIQACGGKARSYPDFRKMLDDRDIQAVCISTPDHWHCLQAMMACAAGKDVYVEKPLSLFVREGRWLTAVARKHKRIVQVGTQQRSGRHYAKGKSLLESGHIGKVHAARSGAFRNVMPGFGAPPDAAAPTEFNYDMWLGPAPKRPYNPKRGLYHFRWFWDYSGGQMTNLGAHQIDIVQWSLKLKGPTRVAAFGRRLGLQDNGETPDTQDAIFEYPGLHMSYSIREASQGSRAGSALEFFGTKGSMIIERSGLRVLSDQKADPANQIPTFRGHTAGGPERSGTKPEPWTEAMQIPGSSSEQFDLHVRNFLDAIKTRQLPVADVEDGHRTAVACHLANISSRVGRSLQWDPEKEELQGDREAAAMLERPYRKPWDSVLRSLLA
ncbi:MAG TPA: Gfo/Idh/MocA family oxidoreductase [Bryobacteraceae bacterium]|nr:Gfo/Idh/MocA family oxidoreductase [Bryobacteraceae bacterium]